MSIVLCTPEEHHKGIFSEFFYFFIAFTGYSSETRCNVFTLHYLGKIKVSSLEMPDLLDLSSAGIYFLSYYELLIDKSLKSISYRCDIFQNTLIAYAEIFRLSEFQLPLSHIGCASEALERSGIRILIAHRNKILSI